MKYLDEFRDPGVARALTRRLHAAAARLPRPVRVMEICGGHTTALLRAGIHSILPPAVRILSGPGCPVCVTPGSVIDEAIWLAQQPRTAVFTFGDMARVPGTNGALMDAAAGERVQFIYSPMQAVAFAQGHPDLRCVLLGIGFETTAPTVAAAVLAAAEQRLANFFCLSAGKRTPPAMRALLEDPHSAIDGFIAPGHVTTVIGADAYAFIGAEFGKPCVVAGFETCDLLEALALLVEQIAEQRREVVIQYRRSVTPAGNRLAQAKIAEVFSVVDDVWRGLGLIPASGYALNARHAACDARRAFAVPVFEAREPAQCRCGDVLRGVCVPRECPLFGAACTPEHPVGPCMVSSEGSCAAHYHYAR